jgi:hypothetical protein
MRGGLRLAFALSCALALLVSAASGLASLAYADHETRTSELQQTGVDPWLMALSMGGMVLLLVFFAAAVLLWERSDRDHPKSPTLPRQQE